MTATEIPDPPGAAGHPPALAACALVVHVWHTDTLDDLARAYANFPADSDRYVTYAESFSEDLRRMIAERLPGAHHVPVRNVGQDVGALFQLMDQVDLGRYGFICKIHSKKGTKMPEAWRRTLLGGVLGSPRQAETIIRAFRADPELMLAGAEQLFLHGPSYLWNNAPGIEALCAPALQGFDFRASDWGFIAGTCFWIRTAILQRLKALGIVFEPGAYADDGTPAHTLERMFGMMVAIEGGKVLLHDQRDSAAAPRLVSGFPETLPRERIPIVQTLANLEQERRRRQRPGTVGARRRVAVFASHSTDGMLPPQVLPYLEGLRPFAERIVVVCDTPDLDPLELDRIGPLADHVIAGAPAGQDFGSYGLGVAWLREAGHLDEADDLILCNDSCFGPIGSFGPMFATMEARRLDFWGAATLPGSSPHLQDLFMVLGWQVFQSPGFHDVMHRLPHTPAAPQAVAACEADLTRVLAAAGFRCGALVESPEAGERMGDPGWRDITEHPLRAIGMGLPLVKAAALRSIRNNAEGPGRLLAWLEQHAPAIHRAASADMDILRFRDAADIGFSLIMPTRDRGWCIANAIRSVLAQSHRRFELVIVDDGSTDDTAAAIRRDFAAELESGRLRYIALERSAGVCVARNIGLSHAAHDWIGYVDSDNQLRPDFLSVFANAIIEHPQGDCFYGQFINKGAGSVIGRPFLRRDLLRGNYIDLGVFVHRRSLVHRFGGFDPDLRRLVDWDLIIRFTGHKDPVFIPRILLDYTDQEDGRSADRISLRESLLKATVAVHTKHHPRPTVSTAIIGYNHQEFIVEAVESALEQRGDFTHEILLADDGSTDGTAGIMARYAARYPRQVRNISTGQNLGISGNYRHCFREAGGRFLAILEGDDYWIDPEKNARQADFLCSHAEAGAVFSRIELFDMARNSRRLLGRQDGLPDLLTGADFAQNRHLNLIVNLSSMMIRRDILTLLPSALYEPRLSEIALAFHLDRLGPIGFIDRVMGVYRLNPSSVWTGAGKAGQLKQAIDTRLGALRVARPAFRRIIRQRIGEKQRELDALAASPPQPSVEVQT